MNSKFTLALIALVGVGVFALPSTMALFAGQHSFYNIDATGNQVPCVKCHGDVKAELTSGYSSTTNTSGPHAKFQCEYCHRAEAGFSSGDDASAEISYSAVKPNTGSIKLVTTIANFENGNFPKVITYRTGMNVSNWNATPSDVQNLDGSNFNDQLGLRDNSGFYRGSLTTFGTAGVTYNFSSASEVGLRTNGVPKDKNTGTQDGAFNPRAVNWTTNTTADYNNSGSREVTPGTQYHAASIVSCMECHGGEQEKGIAGYEIESAPLYNHESWTMAQGVTNCNDCHYGSSALRERSLEAGGFGLTTFGGGLDTGATEAHKDFVGATGGVLRYGYGAANDACVGCHTHVAVSINFQKKYLLSLDANAFTGGGGANDSHGSWGVGNFQGQGTVNVVEYGNGTGGAFGTSPKDYNWTAGTTLYLINSTGSQTAQINGLDHTTDDNATALTAP